MGLDGMYDSTDFFRSQAQKEAGRAINEAEKMLRTSQELNMELQDEISVLKGRVDAYMLNALHWEGKYNQEHALRTKKRSLLDRILGYIG